VNERLFAIEVRRTRLIERAARERGDVAYAVQSLSGPFGFIDRCVGVVRFVVARPPLIAGVMLVLVLLRPRRAFKWAQRAFGLWQSYRWLTKKAVS
jgi:YqjK-like protein